MNASSHKLTVRSKCKRNVALANQSRRSNRTTNTRWSNRWHTEELPRHVERPTARKVRQGEHANKISPSTDKVGQIGPSHRTNRSNTQRRTRSGFRLEGTNGNQSLPTNTSQERCCERCHGQPFGRISKRGIPWDDVDPKPLQTSKGIRHPIKIILPMATR